MELSDYGRIFRRWGRLIAAGTIVALLIGIAFDLRGRLTAAKHYEAVSYVQVNYASASYNPNISLTDEASALSGHAHDPGALQANPRVSFAGVQGVNAGVVSNTAEVQVTVRATSSTVAQSAAAAVAHYLAGLEDGKVAAQSAALRVSAQRKANYARKQWLRLSSRYQQVCGCTGNGRPPLLRPAPLARLGATVQYWQDQLHQDENTLTSVTNPSVPAASVSAGQTKLVSARPPSVMKTVVAALVLGFMLSFLLALGLDYGEATGWRFPAFLSFLPQTPKERLRVPVLGHLPRLALQLEPPGASGTMAARTVVVTNLAAGAAPAAEIVMRLLGGRTGPLYLTSPSRQEATAETALGVAAAMSVQGTRVLLIDADPRGEVTRLLNIEGPGLAEYLRNPQMDLNPLIHALDAGRQTDGALAVLPAGDLVSTQVGTPGPGTSPETAWTQLLQQMAQQTDLVMVSTPPVVEAVGMPGITSPGAQLIMVIRREQADEDLARAYALLRAQNIAVLGLLVNPNDHQLDRPSIIDQQAPLGTQPAGDQRGLDPDVKPGPAGSPTLSDGPEIAQA